MDESKAAGWEAIDRALEPVYGDAEPHHWGTLLRWRLGGNDPLDGISAYPRTDHWHYVSYGMSELYEKDPGSDPEVSGWGFEFTFRLARSEDTPPIWPANLLQNLARYVYTSGNWFEAGHHMDVNGPIAADRDDSAIRAIMFAEDPELGTASTPHGRLQFLQIVGLAPEEYEAARQWNTMSLLDVLAPRLPLYVTDIDRTSLLSDPELAAAVQAGIERDGSSSGMLFVSTADWHEEDGITLRLGALQAPTIRRLLRGRLPFGRPLVLQSENAVLRFEPTDGFTLEHQDDGALSVGIPETALDDLIQSIRPAAGRTPVRSLPGLTVEIVPTRMRDEYGQETGEVVG
ncbi:hypothetical protein GCM10010191_47800 [Actinomadura vinacea]|uniref:Suppressor of fused-like domain-containing protein n=1 Tax=Actinomadura vinacea TaxID=115336 RepID=A0ABN3JFU8_9ACTN